MARQPRISLPKMPLYVLQKGNNYGNCFFSTKDFSFYLDNMAAFSRRNGCAIHCYCLEKDRIHILMTPSKQNSASQFMKSLNQNYVQYVNRKYNRTGTLWNGRFKSCLIQEGKYLLLMQMAVESSPVVRGVVNKPCNYPWSSYAINSEGVISSFLVKHESYLELGKTPALRQLLYQNMFRDRLNSGVLKNVLNMCPQKGVIGDDVFKNQLSSYLKSHRIAI